MKPQPHIETDIDEFFVEQMSRSELIISEIEERENFNHEHKEEEVELHELDDWFHSLYDRDVGPSRIF